MVMPKLVLSNVDDQLAEVNEKMIGSERERTDSSAQDKPGGRGNQAVQDVTKALKTKASEFVGSDQLAKRIQTGALGKDDTGRKTADATERTARATEKIAKDLGKAIAHGRPWRSGRRERSRSGPGQREIDPSRSPGSGSGQSARNRPWRPVPAHPRVKVEFVTTADAWQS